MTTSSYPATPQAFTFQGVNYSGILEGFSGRAIRIGAVHQYLKRRGARVEDMNNGPTRLAIRLSFIGDDCAVRYKKFLKAVDANPYGLLVHPIAGKFQAFCEGPDTEVSFGNGVNLISVKCSWIESNIGAPVAPPDVPSPTVAAQQVGAQKTAFQQATAVYMGKIAQGYLKLASATDAVQSALANVALVTAPIDLVRAAISTAVGATSAAIGAVTSIATHAELLGQDVENFLASTSDIFDGTAETISSDAVESLMDAVADSGQAASDALVEASPTPAGAAEAVGYTDELVASCYVLQAALLQARPPTISYVVTHTTDIVSLCLLLFPDANPFSQTALILGMNRIPNPAVIRAGTVLRVPSK
ncbi:MAG: DNA circularization N-terminal domain-containing protein [Polyangia bacterium]